MWNKITLYKFQRIEEINSRDIPDLDKVLWSTCFVFDYTEYELDNMDPNKVNRLTQKLSETFNAPFDPKPFTRIGKYFIDYEISRITLGQYIELSYFLSVNPVQNAHYILASVSDRKVDHRKKAEYFLTQPITKVMGSLSLIMEKFTALNKEFSSLFGLDKEVNGDVQANTFNKRYGWIYSASQIAEYERIPLSGAMGLPIRQAFNGLAYLKAKARYETELLKQK